ncbi:cold shock domain-containing protein [Streptomyces peucetius]|uniref:Cold shock domain-containing protein n=1 Tax=Streptomyces peucetius TaxID=1950 RepID=A0ABY6IAY0_STRPE|nr:cold shock domain-containing protein [Streptomyces peucetius]
MKWFGPDEGYGVIVRNGGEPDAIVYFSAIQMCCRARGLMTGDKVSFDVMADSEGVRAENVRRTEPGCWASRVDDPP